MDVRIFNVEHGGCALVSTGLTFVLPWRRFTSSLLQITVDATAAARHSMSTGGDLRLQSYRIPASRMRPTKRWRGIARVRKACISTAISGGS